MISWWWLVLIVSICFYFVSNTTSKYLQCASKLLQGTLKPDSIWFPWIFKWFSIYFQSASFQKKTEGNLKTIWKKQKVCMYVLVWPSSISHDACTTHENGDWPETACRQLRLCPPKGPSRSYTSSRRLKEALEEDWPWQTGKLTGKWGQTAKQKMLQSAAMCGKP